MAADCPFCALDPSRVIWGSDEVVAIRDAFPVTEGHTLVIPRAHVPTYFAAAPSLRRTLWNAVDAVQAELSRTHQPDGFNVGFNAGEAAGQTVMHLHIHVIPRYAGAVADPRGGVRHVIPGRGNYLKNGKRPAK